MSTGTDTENAGFGCHSAVTLAASVTLNVPAVWLSVVVGTEFGAWYKPVWEITPQKDPPAEQLTCHVMSVLGVPVTAAVNCWVLYVLTKGIDGVMVISGPITALAVASA